MAGSGEAFCYYYHPDGTFLSAMVHSYDVMNAALGLYGMYIVAAKPAKFLELLKKGAVR